MAPESLKFQECAACAAKPGMPVLCPSCLHNRAVISALQERLPPGDTFLSRLRNQNLSRVDKFGHTLGGWSPMQWGCAIAGEVGELCNVLKKYERQLPSDPSPDELTGMIGEEAADVIIYTDLTLAR